MMINYDFMPCMLRTKIDLRERRGEEEIVIKAGGPINFRDSKM